MSNALRKIARSLLPAVKPPPREWIGALAMRGNQLRELDYPGYQRQRYDGGKYFRFVFSAIAGPTDVHAIGLYHDRTGDGREAPIIINLVDTRTGQTFQVNKNDTVQIEANNVLA